MNGMGGDEGNDVSPVIQKRKGFGTGYSQKPTGRTRKAKVSFLGEKEKPSA